MCGIAGIVDWGGRDRQALGDALDRMDGLVRRRGPDGDGRVVIEGAGAVAYLSHRRLAILDRSEAGRQPMASASGRHWITYNGETYNYRDLTPRLRDAGVVLKSTADTEVLVELLACDGPESLARVRGMFAFGAFDRERGVLTLARDRFGIKPLVWSRPEPDLVLFASSPQALRASGWCDLRPRRGQRAAFLSHGSIPAGEHFWEGVESVPPASTIELDAHRSEVRHYWSAHDPWTYDGGQHSAAEVAAKIRPAVEDSVRAHLVSDVPVAVFLSGGLDSTALAATAARAITSLRTITVSMPDGGLDESALARATAQRLGTDHAEISVADFDRDRLLDAFFDAMSQPTVDGLNTFVVARAAREAGVQVALSGVGGDELFGGYPSFVDVPRLHDALRRGGTAIRVAAPLLSAAYSSRLVKLATIANLRPKSLTETWWAYRGVWSPSEASALTGEPVPPSPLEDRGNAFNVIRHLEWRHFLQRQLLPDADAFTMCRALELRTPFVDHQVVEAVTAAGRWPRGRHMSWKAALFEAWPDWLPATSGRAKRGFVLPMDRWLRQALTDPSPTVWRDVADALHSTHSGVVRRFLDGRLHWTAVWALYVLHRVEQAR